MKVSFLPDELTNSTERMRADKKVKVLSNGGAAVAELVGGKIGQLGTQFAWLGNFRPFIWSFRTIDDLSNLKSDLTSSIKEKELYATGIKVVLTTFELSFVGSSALRLATWLRPTATLAKWAGKIGTPAPYLVAVLMSAETIRLSWSGEGTKKDRWNLANNSLELLSVGSFLIFGKRAAPACSLLSMGSGLCELQARAIQRKEPR